MCGGSKTVTSTTNSEPPAYLAGPLQTAANAAVGDFNQSTYQPYQVSNSIRNYPFGQIGQHTNGFLPPNVGNMFGGQPFGGVGPATQTGAQQPTDLIGQSRALTSGSLSGAFLHPESNPYLASTFNRAADLTRTRLDSEFAGAGRNLGASMPARSEELQTLASNLFGQNYQAERDRQLASQGQAQELDPINLLINRLAGITPGAGGKTTSTQPIIRTGIF